MPKQTRTTYELESKDQITLQYSSDVSFLSLCKPAHGYGQGERDAVTFSISRASARELYCILKKEFAE